MTKTWGIIQIFWNFEIFWNLKDNLSALCFILYITSGLFRSTHILKFPWLTPRTPCIMMIRSFGSKMSANFTKNVHKQWLQLFTGLISQTDISLSFLNKTLLWAVVLFCENVYFVLQYCSVVWFCFVAKLSPSSSSSWAALSFPLHCTPDEALQLQKKLEISKTCFLKFSSPKQF